MILPIYIGSGSRETSNNNKTEQPQHALMHNSKKRCFFFRSKIIIIIIISCFWFLFLVFLTCMHLCIYARVHITNYPYVDSFFDFFNSYVWLVHTHVCILQITRINKCIWWFLCFLIIWGFQLNLPPSLSLSLYIYIYIYI